MEENDENNETLSEQFADGEASIESNQRPSSIPDWQELCQAIESVLTITPVEDPEAERLERILDTVNDYINSEFVDMEIPEVDKIKKKIAQFSNSISSILTKIRKYSPVPLTTAEASSLSSLD